MPTASTSSEDFPSVVLRGRNVGSFKFALAKSVLSLVEAGATSASLEELAVPFSQELCAHIKEVYIQSKSASSRFLDACRHFNSGVITEDELVTTTVLLGFHNLEAFHAVGTGDVETRFFHDERQQCLSGIRFADELLAIASDANAKQPLEAEGESRRLVAPDMTSDQRAQPCGSCTTDQREIARGTSTPSSSGAAAKLRVQLDDVEARLAAARKSSAVANLVLAGDDLRATWDYQVAVTTTHRSRDKRQAR